MRLIDADALIKSINKRHEVYQNIVPNDVVVEAMYEYAVKVVSDAPTVHEKDSNA